MKPLLGLLLLGLLSACGSTPSAPPPNTGPTKEEVKAREDFAKSLPKPPER